jgi:hypothetical protein
MSRERERGEREERGRKRGREKKSAANFFLSSSSSFYPLTTGMCGVIGSRDR